MLKKLAKSASASVVMNPDAFARRRRRCSSKVFSKASGLSSFAHIFKVPIVTFAPLTLAFLQKLS